VVVLVKRHEFTFTCDHCGKESNAGITLPDGFKPVSISKGLRIKEVKQAEEKIKQDMISDSTKKVEYTKGKLRMS